MISRHIRNVRGFFSDYYLGSIFASRTTSADRKTPSEWEGHRALRYLKRLWERAKRRLEGSSTASACRQHFTGPLLRDLLGFHLGAGEGNIYPLFPSAEASGQKPLLLAYCGA